MKPAPPDPAEILHRVRQQLILAQARIMELQDTRDETAARLVDSNQLLLAAQTLADHKLDETAHLEKTRADLQAQFEHLRHVQHVTNQALESARAELATAGRALGLEKQLTAGLADQLRQLQDSRQKLEARLGESLGNHATQQRHIEELAAAVFAMKSSRSWRWTAWLRSLERTFGAKKP